jgi:hypothetical protein
MPKLNNASKQQKELVKAMINEILRSRLKIERTVDCNSNCVYEEDCYSLDLDEFFEDEYDDLLYDLEERNDNKIYVLEIFYIRDSKRILIEKWFIKNYDEEIIK